MLLGNYELQDVFLFLSRESLTILSLTARRALQVVNALPANVCLLDVYTIDLWQNRTRRKENIFAFLLRKFRKRRAVYVEKYRLSVHTDRTVEFPWTDSAEIMDRLRRCLAISSASLLYVSLDKRPENFSDAFQSPEYRHGVLKQITCNASFAGGECALSLFEVFSGLPYHDQYVTVTALISGSSASFRSSIQDPPPHRKHYTGASE